MRLGLVCAFVNLDARHFYRLCGRIERPSHFDLRSDVGLNEILIIQVIDGFGGGVVQHVHFFLRSRVRPVENASFRVGDTLDGLNRRLRAIQMFVGDSPLNVLVCAAPLAAMKDKAAVRLTIHATKRSIVSSSFIKMV